MGGSPTAPAGASRPFLFPPAEGGVARSGSHQSSVQSSPVRPRELEQTSQPPLSVSVRSVCLPTHTPQTPLTLSVSLSLFFLLVVFFRSLCTGRLKCLPGRFPGSLPQSSRIYSLQSSSVLLLFFLLQLLRVRVDAPESVVGLFIDADVV